MWQKIHIQHPYLLIHLVVDFLNDSYQTFNNMGEQQIKISTLKITSPDFKDREPIPEKFTCDGQNINPSLLISNLPEDTKSLVLIIDDPDAPGKTWVHWVVWNIKPSKVISQNSVPGIEGINDFKQHHYGGPCPPSNTHRYFFKIYALDTILNLDKNSRKEDLLKAMEGHILAKGELMGTYSKR